MKKILFYIHSLNKGGAERVLLTLTSHLQEQYEIYILTDQYDELEYPLSKGITRIDMEKRISQMRGRIGVIKRLSAIRRYCREINPDFIIAFMISSAFRAILANFLSGRKVIAAIRSNPYDDFGTNRKRRYLHFVFSFASQIVCQTEYQKEYFNKRLQKKCVVISNPLTDEVCIEPYTGERKKEIVSVGRLFDYKNHKLLIHAFKKIEKKYPEYKVIIYGEGPYCRELEEEISRCNLENRVFLPGDSCQVAEDIKTATLFVLPSDTEGMPNALMEAMSLGIPCIATDCPCGGPKSLIENGVNGLLCKTGDVAELAELIDRVLSDDNFQRELGSHAVEIRKTCNIDVISEQWSAMIDGK